MKHLATLVFILAAAPALADPPVINAVDVRPAGSDWHFSVTLSHPDTGWEHYADGWRIETATGEILGTRTLMHPHVSEQPFTRSLGGVFVPADLNVVHLRAKCSVDGWASETVAVTLE